MVAPSSRVENHTASNTEFALIYPLQIHQNKMVHHGASEAADKVALARARSMLIDARMPFCYWPQSIKHACFIFNRLNCLRTKMVPLIDSLQGLNQPDPEKIDFSNLPCLGCRAHKYINPNPDKFSP